MVVPANMLSGHTTPVLMSGQCTPNTMMGMNMCGQMLPVGCMTPVAGCMTPVPMLQKSAPPADLSKASTTLPSGACSETASEAGDMEDTAEACAELIEQLEAGGEARAAAIEAISGSVVDLAFDAAACRVVQKAFETAEMHVAIALAQEMQGHIREAIKCPHANHVVQKLLDIIPAEESIFVVKELVGAVDLAKHRYGCRVVCRAVKVHAGLEACQETRDFIDELIPEVAELSRHTFAHYVVEAILECGSADQKHEVACALRSDLMRSAKNRSATYVVEKALLCCDAHDREAIAAELFGSAEALLELVENQFGCHLAKALPRLQVHFQQAQRYLPEAAPLLQKSKYGRRVLQEYRTHMQ
jgi:hypothetical protein